MRTSYICRNCPLLLPCPWQIWGRVKKNQQLNFIQCFWNGLEILQNSNLSRDKNLKHAPLATCRLIGSYLKHAPSKISPNFFNPPLGYTKGDAPTHTLLTLSTMRADVILLSKLNDRWIQSASVVFFVVSHVPSGLAYSGIRIPICFWYQNSENLYCLLGRRNNNDTSMDTRTVFS